MYPLQGSWSVADYLGLETQLLVEYTDGFVRVLPMPNLLHQWIVRFLYQVLSAYTMREGLGEVFFAPLPVQLTPTKYREPDLLFLRPERIQNMRGQPTGADLVVEVVSEGDDNRRRDYEEKRIDYADAGIAEYWIVDPQQQTITVYTLESSGYQTHGVYLANQTANSVLLAGFAVQVDEVFAKCSDGC
jgi:Uma2 family endonuclease